MALLLVLLVALLPVVGLIARGAWLGPGEGIAQRIRDAHVPAVVNVYYVEPNPFNPARVQIYLAHDTTQAQLNAFWCDVVVPAGGTEMYLERTLVLWRQDRRAGESAYFQPETGCSP